MTELSILFADIADSTSLFDKHGDEKARSAIAAVLDVLLKVAQQHQGTLVKTIGDEIMCTFPDPDNAMQAAIKMQESVNGNFVLEKHPINIRVGFHHGKVIQEANDVFGDAVNVAARMTGYAKRNQIITNSVTFRQSPDSNQLKHRSLGKSKIKGKLLPVEIVEILWQQDISQITRISSALDLKAPQPKLKLELELSDVNQVMTDQSPMKTIGRGDDCDLQLSTPMASRLHGEFQVSSGSFRYTDQSTNGTWLSMGGKPVRIHRDTVVLQGEGALAFGEDDFSDGANILKYKITAN